MNQGDITLILRTQIANKKIKSGQGGRYEERTPGPIHRLFVELIWTNDSHRFIETYGWGR